MNQKEPFSIKKRLKSFKYAFAGMRVLIREEHNARIHIGATVLVIICGFLFRISEMEWIAVILCIGMVFTAECLNSSLERTADFIKAEHDNHKKDIKDLAAAAVLFSAMAAFIVGCIIFIPKIIALCS